MVKHVCEVCDTYFNTVAEAEHHETIPVTGEGLDGLTLKIDGDRFIVLKPKKISEGHEQLYSYDSFMKGFIERPDSSNTFSACPGGDSASHFMGLIGRGAKLLSESEFSRFREALDKYKDGDYLYFAKISELRRLPLDTEDAGTITIITE